MIMTTGEFHGYMYLVTMICFLVWYIFDMVMNRVKKIKK